MKIHELKTINPYFSDVYHNKKTFEVRFNDRNFEVGDFLLLREYEKNYYLYREIFCEVIYIISDHSYVKEGYVIMGIEVIRKMGSR